MTKGALTLGGISKIEVFLFDNKTINENDLDILLELNMSIESKEDKIYKLVKDYLHILNSKVCYDNESSEGCLLCKTIMTSERDTMVTHGKRYQVKIHLLKTSELEIVKNEKYTRLIYNVENELKHYKLTGTLSNSTTDCFIFPTSILKYSNSRMYLELKKIKEKNCYIIWRSDPFFVDNMTKVSDNEEENPHFDEFIDKKDCYQQKSDDVNDNKGIFYIFTKTKKIYTFLNPRTDNFSFDYSDLSSKLVSKSYKLTDIIKKTKELHTLLKNNRINLNKILEINQLLTVNNKTGSSFNSNYKLCQNDENNVNLELKTLLDQCKMGEMMSPFDDTNEKRVDNNDNNIETSEAKIGTYSDSCIFGMSEINIKSTYFKQGCTDEKLALDKRNIDEMLVVIKENLNNLKLRIKNNDDEIVNSRRDIIKLREIINKYRNNMFVNLSNKIYPISFVNNGYVNNLLNIRGTVLPIINVIQNYDNKEDKDISTSLGYVLHYILIVTNIMEIPLSHKIKFKGSFSTINDIPLYIYPNVTKEQIKKSFFHLKSIIYNELLNYFNINHRVIRKLFSTNNILIWLLAIKNVIMNQWNCD